jgi:hypothetical protein
LTSGLDISMYQQTGATLYFYVPGVSYDSDSEAIKNAADLKVLASKGETTPSEQVYDVDATAKSKAPVQAVTLTRQGKETKVTIGKLANAPKVTVDYVKGTIKVPAKTEYRLVEQTDGKYVVPATWSGSATSKDATVFDISSTTALTPASGNPTINATKAFAVDVRTAAVTTGSTPKLASKIGHNVFPAAAETKITDGDTPIVAATAVPKTVSSTDTTIKNYTVTLTNTSLNTDYTITYVKDDKGTKTTKKLNKASSSTSPGKVTITGVYNGDITAQAQGNKAAGTWGGTDAKLVTKISGVGSKTGGNTDVAKLEVLNWTDIDYITIGSDTTQYTAGNFSSASYEKGDQITIVMTANDKTTTISDVLTKGDTVSETAYTYSAGANVDGTIVAAKYKFLMPEKTVTIGTASE